MNIVPRKDPMQASSSSLRPPRSNTSNTHGRLSGFHVHPTSWHSQWPALFFVFVLFAAFPVTVSAAPPTFRLPIGIYPRGPDSSNENASSSNGNISMSVWLPILLVTVVFILFSFCTCVRRCAARDSAPTTSTNRNRTASAPSGNATRPRRRPRRTPSQVSTKSLPPYMKEPGDQELVLFRGPSEMEDDQDLPHGMPTLAEDDEEHLEMRHGTFDIPLNRIESFDTMADSSTTNLIRRVSASVPRPPELHHSAMPHDHRRSADGRSLSSAGSEAELLAAHTRGISTDPRGEVPSYAEAVSAPEGMTTISLNDPEPNHAVSHPAVPPLSHTADSSPAGRGRARFSFLGHVPFSSHHPHHHTGDTAPTTNDPTTLMRSESPAQHIRSGSQLSRFSSRESHETHHSRAPSRNNLRRSQSRSNSNLFRTFRTHPSGVHAGSSTISLDSISAPLTHTATRAEFHAPRGGLLTPEQIKLITSREGLERFGVPYGPDAVAFSMSKERLAEMGPPPDFESATGVHQEPSGATGSGDEGAEGAVERTVEISDPGLRRCIATVDIALAESACLVTA
ncbi:hypothetical protein JVU11DRAFT_6142 [Chiua virens]|nr:hypothetical protein JVU11DRAFT_6142 [Chiua virens]